MANLQWFCNKCNSSTCVWCNRECYTDVCACGHVPLSSVGAPAVRASWLAGGSGCCDHWGTTTERYHLTPGERSCNSSDATLDKSFNLYSLNFGMRVLLFPSWGCMNRMKFFLCESFVTPWITQHTQYSKAFNKTSIQNTAIAVSWRRRASQTIPMNFLHGLQEPKQSKHHFELRNLETEDQHMRSSGPCPCLKWFLSNLQRCQRSSLSHCRWSIPRHLHQPSLPSLWLRPASLPSFLSTTLLFDPSLISNSEGPLRKGEGRKTKG